MKHELLSIREFDGVTASFGLGYTKITPTSEPALVDHLRETFGDFQEIMFDTRQTSLYTVYVSIMRRAPGGGEIYEGTYEGESGKEHGLRNQRGTLRLIDDNGSDKPVQIMFSRPRPVDA